jgi:hypothetical protein
MTLNETIIKQGDHVKTMIRLGVGLSIVLVALIVNASEKVIRFSRLRPEPGIQGEPRSTGTR